MPPPSKKRKLTEVAPTTFPNPKRGLQGFGKITKSSCATQDRAKRFLHGKSLLKSQRGSSVNPLEENKKRKVLAPQEGLVKQELNHSHNAAVHVQLCQTTQSSVTKRRSRLSPSLPLCPIQQAAPKKTTPLQPSLVDTNAKEPHSCLESTAFSSSPNSAPESPSISKSSQTPSSPISTNDFTSDPVPDELQEFPVELQDLINLYSAFLTALSLHYAHHGSVVSVDLSILRPGIERAWRKKKVSNDDVRRILAIAQDLGAGDPPHKAQQCRGNLILSDYGNGKICVEIERDPNHLRIKMRPINEATLNAVFTKNIVARWKHHKTVNSTSTSLTTFCSLLPLLPITPCPAAAQTGTLLAKGQRRLEDLKAGAIRAQISSQGSQTPCLNSRPPSSGLASTARNDSLLSRIRAKQLHQATLPPPPSTASLLHKSALQRLEEIVPVMEILTSSVSRTISRESVFAVGSNSPQQLKSSVMADEIKQDGTCSFTMPTLVQHLQMSLRNPIAKEDAIRCVRLLAGEVAPGWVKIKEVGKVIGVTVWRRGRMGREELAKKVEELLKGS